MLGSIQPQPLDNAADGTIPLATIEAAIKPDDSHFAKTRLIALENTIGGKVLPDGYVATVRALADRRKLALHLDGARLWNAAVKRGVEPRAIAQGFDSVSVCLSKGLGAPVGLGPLRPARLIGAAHRWRKMLGGGMRQAGVLAAAGRYAIEHHVARLAEDHDNAARLAAGLAKHRTLDVAPPQTNMVFVTVREGSADGFAAHLAANGVQITGTTHQRWVTHLDVGRADVDRAIGVVDAFFAGAVTMALDAVVPRVLPVLSVRAREPHVPAAAFRRHGAGAGLHSRRGRDRQRVVARGGTDRGLRLRVDRPFLFEHNRPATFSYPSTA